MRSFSLLTACVCNDEANAACKLLIFRLQVSISPTFYWQLLRLQILKAQKRLATFGPFGSVKLKAANKMLVNFDYRFPRYSGGLHSKIIWIPSSVADHFKLIFFAYEEFFHFLLLSYVILQAVAKHSSLIANIGKQRKKIPSFIT